LHTDEADIVLLNHASPLMRHGAIRDGRRLVERDHAERVRLETRAILDYLDTAPLRVELGRIQRLEELIERLDEVREVYLEIDDRAVFASLAYLDDLREFATIVERLAASGA
jgi:hypothetical protein